MGFSRYGNQTKIRMINQPCYILYFEFVLPVPMYCKLDSSVSPTAVKIQLEFLQSIGPKFSVKLTDTLSQILSQAEEIITVVLTFLHPNRKRKIFEITQNWNVVHFEWVNVKTVMFIVSAWLRTHIMSQVSESNW